MIIVAFDNRGIDPDVKDKIGGAAPNQTEEKNCIYWQLSFKEIRKHNTGNT
ncbi:MAG: hypothetical protein Tsb0018_11510 [Opitutales bacterium]|tara:strand:+ start:1063 stop:1215 length:153 start_codon:yes stop_codon:yes gene_type:complete